MKDNHAFLISDSENDIYYQPESAYEILAMECKGKVKPIMASIKPTFTERKIGNSKIISKYDVYEMSSKFKNANQLPLNQLKHQLRNIKFDNFDRNNKFSNAQRRRSVQTNSLTFNNFRTKSRFNTVKQNYRTEFDNYANDFNLKDNQKNYNTVDEIFDLKISSTVDSEKKNDIIVDFVDKIGGLEDKKNVKLINISGTLFD